MLISVRNLSISVFENSQEKRIVDDVSLDIETNGIYSLVGGSGSGKTTTALSIIRLLSPDLTVQSGKIYFNGEDNDLLQYPLKEMRKVRGAQIGMVFQEPLEAFNPVFTIGDQIDEVLQYHTSLTKIQRREKILHILEMVGLPNPRAVFKSYPHQLSGGMRQRAMIAQAISVDPRLIIADEPTSNLDVTLQARIIEVFQKLREKLKLSILLITHDLGIVRKLSDHVSVMTKGVIVEQGSVDAVFNNPRHEYTRKLIYALNV